MRSKQMFRRWWWLAGAGLVLAGWLLFWYLPRPLPSGGLPRASECSWVQVSVRSGEDSVDVTGQVELQALDAVLEGLKACPAFETDYFPYLLERYPLEISLLGDRVLPWHVIAGPRGMVAYTGGGLVWPIAGGEALWPELSALVPNSLLQ